MKCRCAQRASPRALSPCAQARKEKVWAHPPRREPKLIIVMMRLFLFMQLLGAARGWVSKSQSVYGAQISEIQAMLRGENVNRDPRAQLGYLWHMPENPDDTRGLGGGITWAWDPALCTMLAPQFKEDIMWWGNFVNCDNFKAAVSRAFDKCATGPSPMPSPRLAR